MEDFLLNWKPSAETFIAGSSDREKKFTGKRKQKANICSSLVGPLIMMKICSG
jgi:hypothetical protein